MDSKNYVDITRLWFSKMSTFPVPQYLLSCQHRRIEQEIATCLPEESNLEHRGITVSYSSHGNIISQHLLSFS